MKTLAPLPLILAGLLLAACGNLLPGSEPAPDLYTLSPATRFADGLVQVPWQLGIEEPSAVGGLDSNRIAVMSTPNEVKYFAEVRWVERTPRMVQGLIVESFERSRAVGGVDRSAIGMRSDYVLRSELRDFQAELFDASKTPTVHVRLTAKLVRSGRHEVVWSRDFEARAPARTTSARDVVAAFDEALGRAMADLVVVTLRDTPPPR
jgi:cholesterol transport system auxiliary component